MDDALSIYVEPVDFDAACKGEYIYGWVKVSINNKMERFSVFAVLGRELRRRGSRRDDPKTRYKMFADCTVKFALNDEDCDNSKFFQTEYNLTVILCC